MTTTEKVRDYKGENGFIISLQGGLKKYGRLTERQIEVANKFFVNNEENKKSFIPKDVNIKTLNSHLTNKGNTFKLGRFNP